MVRASRPSTAASAVVMNAANSPGTRSWQVRAVIRMASNASKPASRICGRVAAWRRRTSALPACRCSLTVPHSLGGAGRRHA
jgi:hypothetical protein